MDAILLVTAEQKHHALSYRSISMMTNYAQILPTFFRPHAEIQNEKQKAGLARWLEWVEITLDSAKEEMSDDLIHVKHRTTIVVADIVEGFFESVIETCLRNLSTDEISLKNLTGHQSQNPNDRDYGYAVRSWERRLFDKYPNRTDRFNRMLRAFFPKFEHPSNFHRIDELVEKRNSLTHDVIKVSDIIDEESHKVEVSNQDVDDYFEAVGDFILAVLKAIPGDLQAPLPVFDPKFSISDGEN